MKKRNKNPNFTEKCKILKKNNTKNQNSTKTAKPLKKIPTKNFKKIAKTVKNDKNNAKPKLKNWNLEKKSRE